MKLFLSNLRAGRGAIMAWCLMIAAYGLLSIFIYPIITKPAADYIGYIASLSESLQSIFGFKLDDLDQLITFSLDTFASMEFLTFWPPVLTHQLYVGHIGHKPV